MTDGSVTPARTKTPWWRRRWFLAIAAIILIVIVISSTADDEDDVARATTTPSATEEAQPTQPPGDTPSPSVEPTPTPISPPTPVLTPTPVPTPAPFTFGDGTHRVGTDIPPTTYRGEGGGFCYWERTSGFGGSFDEIIANGAAQQGPVVTVEATDAGFRTDDCGRWADDLSAVTESVTSPFDDGTYIVGTDVAAGNWRAPGGEFCYWERLRGFSGELDDIIANGAAQTGPVVMIAASDAGFRTDGCGEWAQ